ncbi:hypothetical protein Golomagni_03244 [Golovinomyces magnicellulatus]|nr:hypothetical protein Golomagni_03244 [Golovinomyces magnicellulatus]
MTLWSQAACNGMQVKIIAKIEATQKTTVTTDSAIVLLRRCPGGSTLVEFLQSSRPLDFSIANRTQNLSPAIERAMERHITLANSKGNILDSLSSAD